MGESTKRRLAGIVRSASGDGGGGAGAAAQYVGGYGGGMGGTWGRAQTGRGDLGVAIGSPAGASPGPPRCVLGTLPGSTSFMPSPPI